MSTTEEKMHRIISNEKNAGGESDLYQQFFKIVHQLYRFFGLFLAFCMIIIIL